jgi:hypothetical protein
MMWAAGIDSIRHGAVVVFAAADSDLAFERGFTGARYDCEGCDKTQIDGCVLKRSGSCLLAWQNARRTAFGS